MGVILLKGALGIVKFLLFGGANVWYWAAWGVGVEDPSKVLPTFVDQDVMAVASFILAMRECATNRKKGLPDTLNPKSLFFFPIGGGLSTDKLVCTDRFGSHFIHWDHLYGLHINMQICTCTFYSCNCITVQFILICCISYILSLSIITHFMVLYVFMRISDSLLST